MVTATWGDWFVSAEIEAVDPADDVAIWYLGCNGFVLRSRTTTLYVDPYFGTGDPPTLVRMVPVPIDPADATVCDAVLVTHEHLDHMHPPSYGPLVEDLGATLYAPRASFERPDYDGDLRAPAGNRTVVAEGDEFQIGDFAVHVRGANDPDAVEPVCYVIEHDTGTFFHGGDSKPAGSFDEIGTEFDVDCGALAFGTAGRIAFPEEDAVRPTAWYMDENQVVEAANALELRRLLPTHYDVWRGLVADPKAVIEHAASFPYPRVVEPVRIGDRVDLGGAGIVPSAALR